MRSLSTTDLGHMQLLSTSKTNRKCSYRPAASTRRVKGPSNPGGPAPPIGFAAKNASIICPKIYSLSTLEVWQTWVVQALTL